MVVKGKVSISLKVGEAKQEGDVGENIARIDSETMKTIGISTGDFIEIIGKKSTAAKTVLAYPEDQGHTIIRIDGLIRKNCDVAINDFVSLRKAEVESAKYIKLAPVDIRISVDSELVNLVRDSLMDRPCVRGDTQRIKVQGHYAIPFKVMETLPRGIIKTLKTTKIDILGEPSVVVEQQNESAPRTTCVIFDVFDIWAEDVRVLEKRKVPKEGLRLILSQKLTFPKPIKIWDLHSSKILEKTIFEVIYDASIPEEQYSSYEGFSVGKDSKGKILVLLACLGYSYPTTAIAEASGVALSTTKRLLWELMRDSFVKGIPGNGVMHTEDDFYPYKYGPLRENHYMLTEKGIKEAERLIQPNVQAS